MCREVRRSVARRLRPGGLIGVSGLVDSGLLTGGASTVIGLSSGGFEVFREGPISTEEIEQAWSELRARP